ncbi:hypothetical protein C8R46DRAFT_1039009 [Mycena filopes]|nr:hypothetical protein C8R46DRAFT_1039009 [Mycena filopes]
MSPSQTSATTHLNNMTSAVAAVVPILDELVDSCGTPFLAAISGTTTSLITWVQVTMFAYFPSGKPNGRSKDLKHNQAGDYVKVMGNIHSILCGIVALHVKSEPAGRLPPQTLENIGGFTHKLKRLFKQHEINTLFDECCAELEEACRLFEVETAVTLSDNIEEMKLEVENMHQEVLELIPGLSDGPLSDVSSLIKVHVYSAAVPSVSRGSINNGSEAFIARLNSIGDEEFPWWIGRLCSVTGSLGGFHRFVVFAARSTPFILLEKTHFPQYHIGESMLPSCRPFMRSIDVEQKVVDHGFCVKVGAALKFNQTKREGYTDFINRDPNTAAWNVGRTEFDEILFQDAGENDTRVVEGVSVGSINFSGENDKQPISAEWIATAKIVDECICPYNRLDFSQGLFGHFVHGEQNNLKMGVIDGVSPSTFAGDWSFSDPSDETTLTKKTTTTTQEAATTNATSAILTTCLGLPNFSKSRHVQFLKYHEAAGDFNYPFNPRRVPSTQCDMNVNTFKIGLSLNLVAPGFSIASPVVVKPLKLSHEREHLQN